MKNDPIAHYSTDFIIRCWPFLLVFVVFSIAGLAAQSYFGKVELHLMLVTKGMPMLDNAFRFLTDLGDLPFALLVAAVIGWRYRWGGIGFYVVAGLLQLVIVQALKHGLFAHHLRPIHFFQQMGITVHSIASVDQGMYYHFPSGHTAMTFTAFLCLATFSHRRWWQFVCGLLAVAVAYSRLYLAQHFILDTIAGATIGILCVIISYYGWQTIVARKQLRDSESERV